MTGVRGRERSPSYRIFYTIYTFYTVKTGQIFYTIYTFYTVKTG